MEFTLNDRVATYFPPAGGKQVTYWTMEARGKPKQLVVTAVARELSGNRCDMTVRTIACAFALKVGTAAAPVVHHSFGVAFDAEQTMTLTGTMTKIEWSSLREGAREHVCNENDLDADRYRKFLKPPSLFITTPPQ